MQIEESVQGDVALLEPDGGLKGAAEAALLQQRLRVLLDGGARGVVLGCRRVDVLGSGALRVLLALKGQLTARGGRLLLLNPGEALRRALAVAGFDRDFEFATEASAALQSAAGGVAGERRALAERLLACMGAAPLGAPALAATADLGAAVLQALRAERA